MLVGKSKVGKSIGTAAVPAAAPTPLNTPSLKRENKGKDLTIPLVPATAGTSAVWGNSNGNDKTATPPAPDDQSPSWRGASSASNATSAAVKPAPWARNETGKAENESVVPLDKPASSGNARSRAKSWADDDSEDDDDYQTSSKQPDESVQQHQQYSQHQEQWPDNFREHESHQQQYGGGGYDRSSDARNNMDNMDRYGQDRNHHQMMNNKVCV